MTIKLGYIEQWEVVGEGFFLPEEKPRRVKIDVNVEGTAKFYGHGKDGVIFYLGQVTGRNTLELAVDGSLKVTAEGSDAWFKCQEVHQRPKATANETFTKVANRKERNPELERMMHIMTLNVDKRMAQMQSDHEKAIAKLASQPTGDSSPRDATKKDKGTPPKADPQTEDTGNEGSKSKKLPTKEKSSD